MRSARVRTLLPLSTPLPLPHTSPRLRCETRRLRACSRRRRSGPYRFAASNPYPCPRLGAKANRLEARPFFIKPLYSRTLQSLSEILPACCLYGSLPQAKNRRAQTMPQCSVSGAPPDPEMGPKWGGPRRDYCRTPSSRPVRGAISLAEPMSVSRASTRRGHCSRAIPPV